MCRSTAIDPGLAVASCLTCGWKGPQSDLLVVMSEGLTLEDTLDRFTKDLLTVVASALSKPLGDFLVRWDIVKPEDRKVLRKLIGGAVADITGATFEYIISCAPGGGEPPKDGDDGDSTS